jgi:alanine-glyoxylate transaminase/serine-glyoxylate transaminase/serine-pyruvate transaminase
MVHSRVLAASARPTIGHLDPAFAGLMDEVKGLLKYAFRTENALTMPVSAPGSAGMEMCFVNLVEPGDKVIVCVNGVFGGRMRENVERAGGEAVVINHPWGTPVDPERVAQALDDNPDAKIVAFVHAETSTGALSDAGAIAGVAHERGALVIADAVTSLGGVPLLVDEWALDAVYSGSQKCLSGMPGLSPVTFGPAALERIRGRKTPVQSWFLDLNLVMGYWDSDGGRSYHHTAPVNAIYSLHEALLMLYEEGLENAWQRHRDAHGRLLAGLDAMGLDMLVEESARLPQLNAVRIPDGVDDAAVRRALLEKYDLEIGSGLGDLAGKIWRIGLMGESARPENVDYCLGALKSVLGSGLTAAA